MVKQQASGTAFFADLAHLGHYLRKAKVPLAGLILPGALALGASLFEGLTMALLIPLIELLLGSAAPATNPISLAPFLQRLLPPVFDQTPNRYLLTLLGLILAAALAKTALQYLSSLWVTKIIRRFAGNLRKLIYNRHLTFGKLYFDKHSIGYLQQVILGHVNRLADGLHILEQAFVALFMLAVYLTMMLAISWQLTFLVCSVFPVLHLALGGIVAKISRSSEAHAETHNRLSTELSNALTNIPLVKAYSNEAAEEINFARASDLVEELHLSMDRKNALISPLQDIILMGFLLLLAGGIGVFFLGQDQGTAAGYAVFVVLLRRAAAMFGVFNSIRSSIALVAGPIAQIDEVFSDTGKYFVADGDREFRSLEDGIEFRDVHFTYPEGATALRGVSFRLPKGRLTALVGESGAGKTTIINLLLRFFDPGSGKVIVDGVDLRQLRLFSWRSKIALVSQDPQLMNDSVRKNLLYGLSGIADSKLNEAIHRARLDGLIEKLPNGLDTLIGDKGIKLSGGEKQRVSIARAFLKDPEILVLDEATSSLDSRTERLIQEALSELLVGKTAIVIAHRLSTVKHADAIIVLENGEVVEQGGLSDLLVQKGRFFGYWQEQRFIE